jgi:2-polyprenyl-3-methyl-5-hydroxy-6-metoxy-1,4-benzoquinol methylase
MIAQSKEETLKINEKQREFYNKSGKGKNFISSAWSYFRNSLISDFRTRYGIKDKVYAAHKEWMGNLSGKKVLDLGCLRGNALSIYMAKNAGSYLGIDLSDVAIGILKSRLEKNGCVNATAKAIDFYSPEFKEKDFDIIYAYGVIHHFPDMDQLFSRISEVMKPDGMLILYDPLETSLPVKIARMLYRPFQNDKAWEWPFTKNSLHKIKNSFSVLKVHGVLGKSKWAIALQPLPVPGKKSIIQKWIDDDWNIQEIGPALYKCMHVTMCVKRK